MKYNNVWLENIAKWFTDKGAVLDSSAEELFLKLDKYSNYEPVINLRSRYDLFVTLIWANEEANEQAKSLIIEIINYNNPNFWMINNYFHSSFLRNLEAHHFPERNIEIAHGEES